MQQIAEWLEKLGMSEYADRFAENKIDVSVLPHLTDQDLKNIGVALGAEVVNLVAGGKADLKTGADVFIPRWEKQGDGTWKATVVVVGRDGITPPM
jgi:hypothetical protein